VAFRRNKSLISKVIRDPAYGTRPKGRPRALTTHEETEVIEHVRACQMSAHAATFADVTRFINETLLEDTEEKVSHRFVSMNKTIMSLFRVATSQLVEDIRIEATKYEAFVDFFGRLRAVFESCTYDPDLIINCDETSTHAEKSKKTFEVLYDPELNMRPITNYEGMKEHVTLC
jgi:hypothetical protein